ncbi:MAG: hypothetical protein WDO56_05180 [Gammaproteobacteria bacterium]
MSTTTRFAAMIAVGFCTVPRAEQAQSGADWAETSLLSMAHTVELAQVCGWTSDTAAQIHSDLQKAITQLFQDRVLRGQLIPAEAVNAQAQWLLPISFRLLARNAVDWKGAGECNSFEWRQAWAAFGKVRQGLPPDAPLWFRVPEESRAQMLQLRVQSCITQATILLDDRISGADVIANAVRDACRSELLEQLDASLTSHGASPNELDRRARSVLDSDAMLRKISSGVVEWRASTPADKKR